VSCLIIFAALGAAGVVRTVRDGADPPTGVHRAPEVAAAPAARGDRDPGPTPHKPAVSDAARDQVRIAGRSSHFLARLPADDRTWVIDESAAALARGQIDRAQLAAYVDQMASVREFAVIERTAPYLDPESFR
jgi:hypothetical protein